MKRLLVTGSSGLIGSEVVEYFCRRGWDVHGIDNNMRSDFFGPQADTRWNQQRLCRLYSAFSHHELDIRWRDQVRELIRALKPTLLVHAAAQPSHDLAASRPFDDFEVNADGTLNLLEAVRSECPDCVFIYLSTNKVYGDGPNRIALRELPYRWDYQESKFNDGIDELFPIDHCKHSLFGVSKLAADIMVQEYGRYFGLATVVLRGGCLTGPNHSGVELHGFLSYLIRCNVHGRHYTVFGYKGKQVRDNIHSVDVARLIEMIFAAPRSGEVYNIGGGRNNSTSILEAFDRISSISDRRMLYTYNETPRAGDHICYITDLRKVCAHYPSWSISKSLDDIFREIFTAVSARGVGLNAKSAAT